MDFKDTLASLIKIANDIDLMGFADEAVSIDVVAEKMHELSLINHKEEIEKQLVIKWAEYNRVANELRSIEKKLREKDVRDVRFVRGDSGTSKDRFD